MVQAGLFATSPAAVSPSQSITAQSFTHRPSQAVATFDDVSPGGTWTGSRIAIQPDPVAAAVSGFRQAGGVFTVSGAGDIAPEVSGHGVGTPIANTLVGAFAGLIAVAVVAAMFITAEYRRVLIRLTLAASPRRGRVLAAKAIVVALVGFVTGLIGAAVAVPLGERALRDHGNFIDPVSALTELRVVAGTAALIAVAAVLALAVGTVLRSSAGAVTSVIIGVVLPYLLAVASPALPGDASEWLLRLTPAAAFAVQATGRRYPQVDDTYLPFFGYYPLSPWAGFAVLCGYAAAALVLASYLLRRRDT